MSKHRIPNLLALAAITASALAAQTFTVILRFDSGVDGASPLASLMQAANGDLYGTTSEDGPDHSGDNYAGTVFKITPAGKISTLHTFCSQLQCADGAVPAAALVQSGNGDFFGTTSAYGAKGGGTVFKISPGGLLTTLYNFCSQNGTFACTDGLGPQSGLVLATNGDLYGTTWQGGANVYGGSYGGTIFKITTAGALTTIYSFCAVSACADGEIPVATLTQAANGDLYGSTEGGGTVGYGTIFKITPDGVFTPLHSFSGPDGAYGGAMVQAADGNLYGVTPGGGAYDDYGTFFKITPDGVFTSLYSFGADFAADGVSPKGALIQATDGNFYGTTSAGGSSRSRGTVFQITPAGALTTLYAFCSITPCNDGGEPSAGLVQLTDGTFYGATRIGGGQHNDGTIFSLSVGLGPFVEPRPSSGHAGQNIKILGAALSGATSVSFNGTPAVFTIPTASEIVATVPPGATTGTIQVVTPHATLSSNTPFRVAP